MSDKAVSIPYRLGRSIRSYRLMLDELMRQAWAGKRSWDDVAKAAAGVKPAVEMLLAERQLASMGGDGEASFDREAHEAVLADLGPARVHKRVKVTARTGVDKHGAVVDDKTVAIEGSAADADAIEGEAEVRTLFERPEGSDV